MPKGKNERIKQYRKQHAFFEDIVQRGNGEVYTRLMGRLLQLRNELEGIIDDSTGEGVKGMRPPSFAAGGKKSNDDLANHSSLKAKKGVAKKVDAKKGRVQSRGKGGGRGGPGTGRGGRTSSGRGGAGRGSAGRGGGGRGRGTGGNVARTAPGTVGPCAYCMQLNRNNQSLNLRIDHDELNCARVNEYSKMMDDIEEGAVKGEKANDGDSSYL